MKKINLFIAILMLTIAMGSESCGKSDNEPKKEEEKKTFSMTSTDFDLSNNTSSIILQSQEKEYKIAVTASNNVVWNASVISGNLVTVSPIGEQKGNGTIIIKAKAKTEGEDTKPTEVIIENSSSTKPKITLSFNRSNKILFIPEGTQSQTTAAFNNPASAYNTHFMVESENVAVFWERTFGLDPRIAPRKFDQHAVLKASEEVYNFLTGDLGFASKADSYSKKYKILVFIANSDQGTAYGGGDKNVGMLWVNPPVLQNPRFGIIYHELGHSMQYLAKFDGAPGLTGPVYEMTSQFALLSKFPNWGELEYNHLSAYLKSSHLALGHEDNGYRDAYVLEYWANKYDRKFVSKLWTENITSDNGDFIAAYKRISNTSQEGFNDERFDAARKFMTWDLPSIRESYAKYANMHVAKVKAVTGRTYQILPEYAPQDYGYNGIKLDVPANGTKVQLNFQGMVGAQGFNVTNPTRQGWRYGFVAMKKNKERVYSSVGKNNQGLLEFVVPDDTEHLWLVVLGAPTTHIKHVVDSKPETDNQWPYQFTIIGTQPTP